MRHGIESIPSPNQQRRHVPSLLFDSSSMILMQSNVTLKGRRDQDEAEQVLRRQGGPTIRTTTGSSPW